jgi:hypothetical protein
VQNIANAVFAVYGSPPSTLLLLICLGFARVSARGDDAKQSCNAFHHSPANFALFTDLLATVQNIPVILSCIKK